MSRVLAPWCYHLVVWFYLKRHQTILRILLLVFLVAGIAAFVILGGPRMLTWKFLVAQKEGIKHFVQASPSVGVGAFILAYVVLGGFCLPGATILHISGGVLFGFWLGLILVCLAGTGATVLGFLTSRFLLRDLVARYAGGRVREIENGIAREGGLFVFALRLIPVIPFSVTNAVLGICPISFGTYVWVSFVGSLPRYVIYVVTGAQLGRIRSPQDILSRGLLATLTLLGLLPLILKHSWRLAKPWLRSRLHF